MRLSLFSIFIFAFSAVAENANSQSIHVTLHKNNISIAEVLNEIENQTDFLFLYNKKNVNTERNISINVSDKQITEVLTQLFNGMDVHYTIEGKHIVLSKTNPETGHTIAQQSGKTIKGIVKDNMGESIIGANVVIKGSTSGTITDMDGNFSLDNVSAGDLLVVSYIGYLSKEMLVSNQTRLEITLIEDTRSIDEVVVIGYGIQRKGDVTSSVGSVKKENFLKGAVKDAGQLIQGQVAGLTITNPSGEPTGNTQILLRGNTTIMGGNSNPLILVDGVPGDFNTVAPEDIESVDVLKDGSAAAIYGTRGTNGVILITTKKAKGNNINEVEYSTYISTSTIAKRLEVLDAADYRRQIAEGSRDGSWDLGDTTDWFDQITRTPVSHVHNLSFKGGNAQTNYIMNLNYRSLQGIFKKSDKEMFQGRAEINHNMFDNKLKVNAAIIGNESGYTSTSDGGAFNTYIYRQSLIQNPTQPIRNASGGWYQNTGLFEYENPMSQLYESDGRQNVSQMRFNGSLTFNPINDLNLKALFSYDKTNQYGGYYETKQHCSTLRDGKNGYAAVGAMTNMTKLMELTAQYSKEISGHHFSLLGGYSYQGTDYSNQYEQNWDFPTDLYSYNNIGTGKALKEGLAVDYSYRLKTNLIGFFGRATYAYKNRYLLMGSIRHEAASQLVGTKAPWGTFPSISLGWRITEEAFMQNQSLFNDLKLRAGYGVTGSQPSDSFLGLSMLKYDAWWYNNGKWLQTLSPSQNPNPDLRWEEKIETNLGLDFSILDNRISGSIDLYNREINGLLYDYDVPSPPNLYNSTRANVGVMSNKGVELLINFVPFRTENFNWSSSVTFSTNSNKLKSLSNDLYQTSTDYFMTGWIQEPIKTESHIVKVGQSIGNFYGFKVIDIDENGKWIYEDKDGNAVAYDDFSHTFEDKKIIGNGLPSYYAGWNNNFRYKNFDLSITMRGAFDYQVLNSARMFYENKNRQDWNRLKSSEKLIFGKAQLNSSVPQEYNSYYIENGDHWKIDNITLGYTIRNTGIKYINSCRVYVSSMNTLTLSGYKGTDPEVSRSGLNPGYDNRDQYPNVRSFTLGVNVNF